MMLPIVHHPAYAVSLPDGHRFPMDKFGRLIEVLRADGLAAADNCHEPYPAPRWWLELVHDSEYVGDILDLTAGHETMRRIGLPLTPSLAARARLAVAGTVLTAELALAHGLACNTAGGSHHAQTGTGAGFCVFNDVAVAARVMQAQGRALQMLVIDLDVHQGDGTAEIFHGDPAVFTFSVHGQKNYPVRKQTSDFDVPLPDDVGDEVYLAILRASLDVVWLRVRPDLVFYNAGVDPHVDDRLGKLALSDAGLLARDRMVIDDCLLRGLPLACVIGGGYGADVDAIARRHALLYRAAADALTTTPRRQKPAENRDGPYL